MDDIFAGVIDDPAFWQQIDLPDAPQSSASSAPPGAAAAAAESSGRPPQPGQLAVPAAVAPSPSSVPRGLGDRPAAAAAVVQTPLSSPVSLNLQLVGATRIGISWTPSDRRVTAALKEFPGAHWDAALSCFAAPRNSHDLLCNQLQQQLGSMLTVKRVPSQVLKACSGGGGGARPVNDEAKERPGADFDSLKIPSPLRESLFPFQRAGIEFVVSRNGRALIADEMGLGKTLTAIASACHYDSWPVVVVCPSSLRFSWHNEWKRWAPSVVGEDGLGVQVISTGKQQLMQHIVRARREQTAIGFSTQMENVVPKVVVISYDLVPKYQEVFLAVKFQMAILDESHYIKSSTAQRTKALQSFLPRCPRVLLLSGTPALSRPIELYTQVSAVSPPGYWATLRDFGVRYCNGRKGRFGWEYAGSTNTHELNYRLSSTVMIRRLKAEVLRDLPQKTRSAILVEAKSSRELSKLQKELGAAGSDSLREMLERALDSGRPNNSLLKAYHESGSAKLPAISKYIEDLIEGGAGKFLIFAHHKAVMDGIATALELKNVPYFRIDGQTSDKERKQGVERFQSCPVEECRVALLSLTAASTGLTLTEASLVVFAELYWTPSILQQAEDRVHRVGQRSAVQIHYILGQGTVDEQLWELVSTKLKVLSSVVDGRVNQRLQVEHTIDLQPQPQHPRQTQLALVAVEDDLPAAGKRKRPLVAAESNPGAAARPGKRLRPTIVDLLGAGSGEGE